MDDYSHCYLYDNERECVSFHCDDDCRYFREFHEKKQLDHEEWNELFEL